MKADRTSTVAGHQPTRSAGAGATWTDGAAVHPRFLRFGPWVLSLVVAMLFVLSFATSYAALYDYALQLEFGREFAAVFPLVLDAVISVLAVTVLLERALRRRTVTIKGWQVTLRWPTWPLGALWIYFGGSVAGNVAHAPSLLAAQLVAAVPPISAALTFHLLLRLLDRAPSLRMIAETYEERAVEEQERAARRLARRAQIKARRMDSSTAAPPLTRVTAGEANRRLTAQAASRLDSLWTVVMSRPAGTEGLPRAAVCRRTADLSSKRRIFGGVYTPLKLQVTE